MGERKKIRKETKDHIYPTLEDSKQKKKKRRRRRRRKKNSETIVASIGSIICEAVRLISSYSGHTGIAGCKIRAPRKQPTRCGENTRLYIEMPPEQNISFDAAVLFTCIPVTRDR